MIWVKDLLDVLSIYPQSNRYCKDSVKENRTRMFVWILSVLAPCLRALTRLARHFAGSASSNGVLSRCLHLVDTLSTMIRSLKMLSLPTNSTGR